MGFDSVGSDERGATPVVGIVLLVAIAIVMAAVIGQYVFGLDLIQSPEAAPQVSFSEDYDDLTDSDPHTGTLTLRHESGDKLEENEIEVVVSNDQGGHNSDVPAEVTSSETITVEDLSESATVRIIWTSPETGDSYVVHTWEGPQA